MICWEQDVILMVSSENGRKDGADEHSEQVAQWR